MQNGLGLGSVFSQTPTIKLFCEKSERLEVVTYFHKQLHRRCSIGFGFGFQMEINSSQAQN